MERKKRSKGRGWESCYVKKIYGTFGVEMRTYGQKLVQFCTHTHTHTHTHASPIVVYMLMSSQLYEWIHGYRQWWKLPSESSLCSNCRVAENFPEKPNSGPTEGLPEGEVSSASSLPTDQILRYIRTYNFTVIMHALYSAENHYLCWHN